MSSTDELERHLFNEPLVYDTMQSQQLDKQTLICRTQYLNKMPKFISSSSRRLRMMAECQRKDELVAHGLDMQPRTVRDRLRAKLNK